MFKARVTVTWWYNNNAMVCHCSSCAGKTDGWTTLEAVLNELTAEDWQCRSMKLTSRNISHVVGTVELQRGEYQFLTLNVFPF